MIASFRFCVHIYLSRPAAGESLCSCFFVTTFAFRKRDTSGHTGMPRAVVLIAA